MSNVIPFPVKDLGNWHSIHQQITTLLEHQGYSEAFIAEVLRRFRGPYDQMALAHTMNFDGIPAEYLPTIQAQTDALRDNVSELIHSLLGTLVATLVSALEAEGYR